MMNNEWQYGQNICLRYHRFDNLWYIASMIGSQHGQFLGRSLVSCVCDVLWCVKSLINERDE